jgi:hypothetical protein
MSKVETNAIVGSDAAVAQVSVDLAGWDRRTYTGTSKKHPKDAPNHTIGEALALARALRKAAEDLEFQASTRIEWEANRPKVSDYLTPYRAWEYNGVSE